jgi:hypothetical protein
MFFFERVSRLHSAVRESYPVEAANGSPGDAGHLRAQKRRDPAKSKPKLDHPMDCGWW